MCGIVAFFGQLDGLVNVLEALHLLEYRAPDSTGVGAVVEDGRLAVRRSTGAPKKLIDALAADSLYLPSAGDEQAAHTLFARQQIDLDPQSLRDCSPYAPEQLYQVPGLSVGVGDRGAWGQPKVDASHFSARLVQTLEVNGGLTSPDYDRDVVRHAFRLVAAHVATQVALDATLAQKLDEALAARIPAGAYANWYEAWGAEVAANTPGQAFAVAVRHFQETFPNLAPYIKEGRWERLGGLTALAMAQIVVGHGRWAMVGAVTVANAHPLSDRSGTRLVCENGSHNARLMLAAQVDQEAWWRQRGVPPDEPVHRSENTTEVIAYEWERAVHQLQEEACSEEERPFLQALDYWEITDREERALRLALHRLHSGNAHAGVCFSRRRPGTLYVSSHNKPIAIAVRTLQDGRREAMVASDVNAALMLWPGEEVDVAAAEIEKLETAVRRGTLTTREAALAIEKVIHRFAVDVVFLDADLHQGRELLACVTNRVEDGRVVPSVNITRYDGIPVATTVRRIYLNPSMVGKQGYATYTERHIDEIPDVLDGIIKTYLQDGRVALESIQREGGLAQPGLNIDNLRHRYGDNLAGLKRLLLIGEGSSWRDAQAAAPLFRQLLPDVLVNIYRPVQVLNLGEAIDAKGDLAIEISWSGTTDSVLKVDNWLAEMEVLRLAITGRPQSDLGRRAAVSAGTLDVYSGVEVSVATVKGYHAILTLLNLLALYLGEMYAGEMGVSERMQLINEVSLVIPQQVRAIIAGEERRARVRRVARRCRHFNKVAVVGNSPIVIEAELKIEELAQVVANNFDFHTTSLRALIEHTALASEERRQTLFVVNATTPEACREVQPIVAYLRELGVFCIIHTIPHERVEKWQEIPTAELFLSAPVSEPLQPLIDALFFFDLAVALAYGRGLLPEEIDRPRNLAKSVTTTGAERRVDVEARREFNNVSLQEFGESPLARVAWSTARQGPSRIALRATVALRAALAVLSGPLPSRLTLDRLAHLVIVTDTEATENAAYISAVSWQELLGVDVAVYRRFISELPPVRKETTMLRLIRAGALLAVRDAQTIALPTDLAPLQQELLAAVYLTGLAVRLARQQGQDTSLWERGLAQLPLILADLLADTYLARRIRRVLLPFVTAGYDKVQIIGGGQDHAAAISIARSLRMEGFMAEALYTDSAWHGPLATVGGPDAEHDTLIIILATDPLFQATALVDTQVYRTRQASVLLVVPEGNEKVAVVRGVDATAVVEVTAVPRPFTAAVNAALGSVLARQMAQLWQDL